MTKQNDTKDAREQEVVRPEKKAPIAPEHVDHVPEREEKSRARVPDELISKRHMNHYVVLGWLIDRINASPDAEELRASVLMALDKSRDEKLVSLMDDLKAYVASHDRTAGLGAEPVE